MKIAIGLVALAMGLDLLTFSLVIGSVAGTEINPVMARAYAQFGLLAVILLKFVGTLAIILIITRLRTRSLRRFGVAFGVGVGTLGFISNISAVVIR